MLQFKDLLAFMYSYLWLLDQHAPAIQVLETKVVAQKNSKLCCMLTAKLLITGPNLIARYSFLLYI
jgi:hypothetical protein